MNKYDLSILIPARNEQFLARTVQDILTNKEGKTEIIVGMDGEWSDPPITDHPDVKILYSPVSLGQRAMTNQLARLSNAKYVIKTDAHCAFDKGFDVKLMSIMQDDWTLIPVMRNLHAFDWVCTHCKHRTYQGPTPEKCPMCDNKMVREMIWKPKPGVRNRFFRYDNTLHFQYWKEFQERPEGQKEIAETMSIQGSFFMMTRKKYWELDICDERHGSWGQQGVEVANKTWLSGGKVMAYKGTWYAHMFRTQGGDFGFPYPNPGIEKVREYSRKLWFSSLEELKKKWPPAKHDIWWLIKKFSPVPDWDKSKGIIYYTDNKLPENIFKACQNQLKFSAQTRRIVSASLKPIDFGDNICLPLERGYLTMAKQILAALKEVQTDIVFFCEHDVLYHPSHFNFIPVNKDIYYYNTNVWKVRLEDGHAYRTNDCKQLSGLCAYRETLLKHFEERVRRFEEKTLEYKDDPQGFNRYIREVGFEPGTHNRAERIDDLKCEKWEADFPNIDIRHGENLTPTKWSKDQFRNKRYADGWIEANELPGWGLVKGKFTQLIDDLSKDVIK